MTAALCFRQIAKRTFSQRMVTEKSKLERADFHAGRRVGDDAPEHVAHRQHLVLERSLECLG